MNRLNDLHRQRPTRQVRDIGRQQHPLFPQRPHQQTALELEGNVQPANLKADRMLDLQKIPRRARIDRDRHSQRLPFFF